MANYKFIGGDGKEYGPYSAEQMRQFLSENRLVANSQVSADGGPFQPASTFPELGYPSQPPGPGYPSHVPQPVMMAPAQTTNPMAITGMIMGILAILASYPCCGIPFNILGIIFSCVGLSQIKKQPSQAGRGMAIAGLICSIISLLIVIVLIGFGVMAGILDSI